MECPSCGKDNKPDAAFCMGCGAPLPDVPFSQLKKDEAVREAPKVPPRVSLQREEERTAPMPRIGEGEEGSGGDKAEAAQAGRPAPAEPTLAMPAAPGAGAPTGAPAAVPPVTPEAKAAPPAPETPLAPPGPPAPPAPPAAPPASAPVEPGGPAPTVTLPVSPPPAEAPPATGAPAASPPSSLDEPALTTSMRSVVEELVEGEKAPREAGYYVPPEADYGVVAPRAEPLAAEKAAAAEVATPPGLESTQAFSPVSPPPAAAAPRKVICPECYAPNPEGNSFCQDCGSALPMTSMRRPASPRPAPPRAGYQRTAVMSPEAIGAAAPQPAYAAAPRAKRARGERSFGVADVLALVSMGTAGVAIALSYGVASCAWKKGLDMSMFSHQGAYTQGRADLLGGPGVLPYAGAEFLTLGLVTVVGLALALVFLAVRVGRGPMYILAGSTLVFPAAYLLFQAILPLRQMGIDIQPAVGLRGVFFGDAVNPGVGPPLWMISGAGLLLLVAGFLAPPRGWGRLFTFLLCFSIVVGAAFFCAACYNWNLFISQPAASLRGQVLYFACCGVKKSPI